MSSTQRVSCRSMQHDAEELQEAMKQLPQIIHQLQTSMQSLAQCWDGPAWSAFQMQVTKDIQNMNDVYKVLTELQKGLGKGREVYLKTEFSVYSDLKTTF